MIRQHIYMAEESGDGSGSSGGGDESNSSESDTLLGNESGGDDAGDESKGEGDGEKAKAGSKDSDGKPDGEEAKGDGEDQQEEGEKPGEFDTSKFEVPEGSEINETWMGKFVGNEAIQKLTQSDAQGLIGMVGEFVAEQTVQTENARIDTQNARTAEWVTQVGKDAYVTEHGMDVVLPRANAAINEIAKDHPEFRALLNETGLGSHPAMVVGMARLAEALHLGDTNLEGGGKPPGSGAKGSAAHKLFPDHAPGGKYASESANA